MNKNQRASEEFMKGAFDANHRLQVRDAAKVLDATGLLSDVVAIEKAAGSTVLRDEVLDRRRIPSFAKAPGGTTSVDLRNHADLNANSNLGRVVNVSPVPWPQSQGSDAIPGGQRVNKNAEIAAMPLSEMGGSTEKTEVSGDGIPGLSSKAAGFITMIKSQCARHCKQPGRTTCQFCFGEGYHQKMARLKRGQIIETDRVCSPMNAARHLMPGD